MKLLLWNIILGLFASWTMLVAGEHGHHHSHHEISAHPKYQFDYGVKDAHTGDHKSQWEHRDGDHVKGGYTLDEADGTKRVVEYHSDHHNGFQAVVKRVGHASHPQHYHVHHDSGHHDDYNSHKGSYGGHHHASSYANLVQHHDSHHHSHH